jgi:hypothetical protein
LDDGRGISWLAGDIWWWYCSLSSAVDPIITSAVPFRAIFVELCEGREDVNTRLETLEVEAEWIYRRTEKLDRCFLVNALSLHADKLRWDRHARLVYLNSIGI